MLGKLRHPRRRELGGPPVDRQPPPDRTDRPDRLPPASIGLLNWTMLPRMGEIWDHLLTRRFPPWSPPEVGPDPVRRPRRPREADPRRHPRRSRHRSAEVPGPRRRDPRPEPQGGHPRWPPSSACPTVADRESTIEADAAAIRRDLESRLRGDPPPQGRRRRHRATESAHFPGPFIQQPQASAPEPATTSTPASAWAKSWGWASKKASAPGSLPAAITSARPRAPVRSSWPGSSRNCRRRKGETRRDRRGHRIGASKAPVRGPRGLRLHRW